MFHTHAELRPSNLARLELDQNRLRFYPANQGQVLERRFSEHDRRILSSLTLLGEITEAVLLHVGRGLYEWLDGRNNWCAHLPASTTHSPALLEISISSAVHPSAREEAAVRFLEAPWELLADERGHLAEHAKLCPYRRLGRGTAPSAPEKSRFSLLFMASSPESEQMPLLFEEEERAILQAVEHLALDLTVEESGDGEQLAASLDRGVDLLHLSCHGVLGRKSGESYAHLLLEDLYGETRAVSPAQLAQLLGEHRPSLFLSACTSAQSWASLSSYALQMLDQGLPAVLGWSGKVSDSEATRFAAAFYGALSRGLDLPHALAEARTFLLTHARNQAAAGGSEAHHDWHLARLYLGEAGGGSLCTGQAKAEISGQFHSKLGAEVARKEVNEPQTVFLDEARAASPVAGPNAFVGRRRPLQQALRHFRNPGPPALLLHSLGRQGKSSLAHRIGQRLPDHRRVVIYGKKDELNQPNELERYGERAILEALLAARSEWSEGERAHWSEEIAEIENRPGYWPILLQQFLGEDKWLLILDDLEQILEPTATAGKYHQAKADSQSMLKGLLRLASSGSCPGLKLLLTSRYNFQIEREGQPIPLAEIALPPMKAYESHKQLRARRLAQGLAAETTDKVASARESRCVVAGRGNPGLQDLLTRLALANSEACDQALDQIELYLATGACPEDAELQAFLNGLALENLLALLSEDERELLRISTLIEVPVPPKIYVGYAGATAGLRLLALGLWDHHEDLCNHRRAAVTTNPLVRPRLTSLDPEERKALAAQLAPALEREWGGPERKSYPELAQLALLELALVGKIAEMVARTTAVALYYLEKGIESRRAGRLADAAVGICEDAGVAMPAPLMYRASQALGQVGINPPLAWRLAGQALEVYEQAEREGSALDHDAFVHALVVHGEHLQIQGEWQQAQACFERATTLATQHGQQRNQAIGLGYIANILVSRGELDMALRIMQEQELPIYQKLGEVREIAVTMGHIADILVSRGELDGALRIRQEQELPVYQKLGEVREIAVLSGKIAEILASRGELDEALRIRQEQELPVYQRLGEMRSIAMAMGQIADILVRRGELDEALRIRREQQLPVFQKLGDMRSIALTMGKITDILVSRGELGEALRIWQEQVLPVFQKLDDVRAIAVTMGRIADILFSRGELDEALRIRQEQQLPAYQKLGDARSIAATIGKVADILFSRGDLDEALRIRQEQQLPAYQKLGDVRLIALTMGQIADILVSRGELGEALRIRQEQQLTAYQKLGDVRSIAVTMGKIADILVSRGELDEALRIRHEQQLPAFQKLGDVREIAMAMGRIAQIFLQRNRLSEAQQMLLECLKIHQDLGNLDGVADSLWYLARVDWMEKRFQSGFKNMSQAYDLFLKLGRAEGLATVGKAFGEILCQQGAMEHGMPILERAQDAYLRLGRPAESDAVAAIIELFRSTSEARPGTEPKTLKEDAKKLRHPSSRDEPEFPGDASKADANLVPFPVAAKPRAVQAEKGQDHGNTSAIIVPFRSSPK